MTAEDRYRSIFESAPVGLILTLPDGSILEANPALVELLGYPDRDALLRQNMKAIWADPGQRDVFLREVERKGLVQGFEHVLRRFDGSGVWVRASLRAVRDETGRTLHYEGAIEDLSERRRVEAELARSEDRFREALDVFPDPIAVHREGRLLYVNPAGLALVGAKGPQEVLGRSILDFVHPDYRELVLERVRRSVAEQRPMELAAEKFLRLDGEAIDVEVVALPVLWQGQPAIQVLIRDVTGPRRAAARLQASEARLAQAQHLARLGNWEWDLLANRFHGSDVLFQVAGIEPSEAGLEYRGTFERIHPDDRAAVARVLETASQGSAFEIDCRLVPPDGGVTALHVRGEVECDAEGRVTRVFGTAQDITDRKRLEQELAEARDAALEASRLKSSFLANMSHEIRTPLNVILGYSAMIGEDLAERSDHSHDPLLEGIQRAGQRLLETIHGVLDLSKIESGTFTVDPRDLDLVALVRREVGDFEVLARRRGLSVDVVFDEPGIYVRFDEYCLSQALGNLLSNALKFTKQGGITVRVSRAADGRPSLEVADTGVGIESAYLSRLFREFSQEQSGYTREFEGAGLGLALTRRYVEMNGGVVSVESEKGRGARFRIHLPPAGGAGAEARPAPRRPTPVEAWPAAPRATVLVIEDEEDTLVYMRTVLGRRYEVLGASGAEEARMVLEGDGRNVRAVLMDLSLRGSEDGLSLTRWIKAHERWGALPVIITTAHAFVEDRARSLEAGCDAYLPKPIEPKALLETIEQLLAD